MVGNRNNTAFAEDRAEVELLVVRNEKLKDLNKRYAACLSRINNIGINLNDAMGPIYNNTQSLSVVSDNADRVLNELSKQTRPLEGKADEERTIHNGPGAVGVQNYLAALKRVEKKLSNLRSSNFRINQEATRELEALIAYGIGELDTLYKSLIKEDVTPLEPLHYITKQLPFPTILQNKTRQLADIDSFFTANQSRSPDGRSTVAMYIEARGAYISGSLQNLASASISTSRKKSPNELYRQGTSGIGHYARGIKGMFLAEWRIVTLVFPRDAWGYIFEHTTRSALTEFSRTLRELSTQIRANMTTDCFLAYEIVGIVNKLAIDMDGDTGQLKQQLVDAVKPVRDTAKVSIGELLDDTRRRIGVMIAFPPDGAALPLTTESMNRLQTLVLYSQPLASILTSLGDGNWHSRSANGSSTSLPSTKSFDVGADGNQLLAHYVLDSIEALLSNLESKGKILTKSKAVFGIFLVNNVAVVDRMIRSSDLQGLLTSTNCSSKLESWRKKGTATYLDAWREPCAALMDVQYTNRGARPPSGQSGYIDSATIIKGLSGKDKDAIKEKFKSFNISFEGLSAKHKEMSGSMEREVRSQLARDIQAMIEPLYARFWDRYHDVDRGRGKYVRYDKDSLSAALASLG